MSGRLALLIIGGYGAFGGRIIELLQTEESLVLFIAGRSIDKATAFCASRHGSAATLVPTFFDRDGEIDNQLASIKPDIVVDASGPFQSYGETRYRIVECCLVRGISYLDLADGSDFVAGIQAFDERARVAGLFILSGVSSFPVLTSAVVRHLSTAMVRIDSIRGGVAPSPYADVGLNVIRAIASYAGQKISCRENGQIGAVYPFTSHRRVTIAPPGYMPLRNTLFSLVDVPDLQIFAILWPDTKTIWMGAGPIPEIFHWALIALSWLVRLGFIRSLSPLAPIMHSTMRALRWGEHRSGMFVAVEGIDRSGKLLRRSWHLVAEGDDGPLIPVMAVIAIIRRVLTGQPPTAGARAVLSDIDLGDYEKLFLGRRIYTGIRDDDLPASSALYARILGVSWDKLPIEIRRMHDIKGTVIVSGQATLERGNSLLSRLAAALIGFPKAAKAINVRVKFISSSQEETWIRTFGNESFSSRQYEGRGRSAGLLCEKFGPLSFAMALVVTADDKLSLILRRWAAFGLPLPLWLCPRSTAFETVKGGKFHFHVEISHWFTGPIVSYKGWLRSA